VHMKRALTEAQQLARQHTALQLYNTYMWDPTVFMRTLYVDEATFKFSAVADGKVHVWCDRTDPEVHATHMNCRIDGGSARCISVRVMLGVNAMWGPVYFEFTTGTTDIMRLHPQLASKTYKVSAAAHTHQVTMYAPPGRARTANVTPGRAACICCSMCAG
jgi:hypothetical protein